MAFNAHRNAVAQAIMAAGGNRVSMMRFPVAAERLVAPTLVPTMTHLAFALSTSTPKSGGSRFFTKGHKASSYENKMIWTTKRPTRCYDHPECSRKRRIALDIQHSRKE